MKNLFVVLILLFTLALKAQNKIYQPEREKINNLVHTKLKVDFNFAKSQLNGEAWITLTPHFYPTNKVTLDAKAFKINEVKVNNINAAYNYSDNELTIELNKTYSKGEEYTVYVNYIARPEEVTQKGSENIVFLNRRGAQLTRVMVFTIIKNLAESIGLKKNISPHTFRHSFATHLIEGGANLRAIQEMLGHESITTTEIYTHLDQRFLRDAILSFHPRNSNV